MIPKRFIRIWLGTEPIPQQFEDWWHHFKLLNPGWSFTTLGDSFAELLLPCEVRRVYDDCDTLAGRSDVLRIMALHEYGGVYVDTDVMPLQPFQGLIADPRPFAALRSRVSFESAVIGSPARHPATAALLEALPSWYDEHRDRAASVKTGPAFVSSVWFGRDDVRHLPAKTFYPFNGFKAPKREEKDAMFRDRNFPAGMLAAHYSNHRWGGKPK